MSPTSIRQQIVMDEVEGVAALLGISEDDAFLRFAHQLLTGRFGCCRQYASTVSRWTRKNASSANSRAPTSANSSLQASGLATPGAPHSGQRGTSIRPHITRTRRVRGAPSGHDLGMRASHSRPRPPIQHTYAEKRRADERTRTADLLITSIRVFARRQVQRVHLVHAVPISKPNTPSQHPSDVIWSIWSISVAHRLHISADRLPRKLGGVPYSSLVRSYARWCV